MMRVGITGGIGSGKSTICRMFGVLGVLVYNSDLRARLIMNEDRRLVEQIKQLLGERAYVGGELDRAYISSQVFNDVELLGQLNALVHPAVGDDFERWSASYSGEKYVILESAILFESGFSKYVDCTVTVSAPEDERIERSVKRGGATTVSIKARIANQMGDSQREQLSDYVIYNDDRRMVSDQVLTLHKIFNNKVL